MSRHSTTASQRAAATKYVAALAEAERLANELRQTRTKLRQMREELIVEWTPGLKAELQKRIAS